MLRVKKRDGRLESYDVEKIHKVCMWAVDSIPNVSVSDIELNANISLYDGISTSEIHDLLIKSASNLISEEFPNYQYVAARLLNYQLRKEVWGESEPPRLLDHIKKCVDQGVYDDIVLKKYTESEIHKLGKYLKHTRDEKFTYSGLQQMIDKYLLKNRNTGEIYETPQFAYMLIAMTFFMNYKEKRLEYVQRAYDYFSQFKINLPTPIVCGVRTKIRQYSSCVLCDVGDSMDSIFSSVAAVGKYTAKRSGIGLNLGRIRPLNSPIRGGEVIHTGVIPFLKVFEATCKSTSQNGIRGGSATVHFPFWHYEIEDIIVLKNNTGTDDNRVRKLDYSIQFSKIFYERLIADEDITLFSPAEIPMLYEYFGTKDFDGLYRACELRSDLKFKKTIKARTLMETFARERLETGRIYVMNIDHCNSHSAWRSQVFQSNLCQEVLHPTIPLNHIDDPNAEIGVCILSAINLCESKLEEFDDVCEIIVRCLDALIDHQEYPVAAAENFTKNRRSLGVGFTNLAGYLAKNKVGYEDKEALRIVDELAEQLQFSLLKASCKLAKEFGACNKFDETTYVTKLPIDHYNKNVDLICDRQPTCDWESLRNEISEYGLRHSTLTAQMPCESSSVIQNSTNGIEPIRSHISYKKSKSGNLKQVVPGFSKYGKYYTKAFEMTSNEGILNIAAVLQKWFDMAISTNCYYNYNHYPDGRIPLSVVVKDILYAYKMGLKTLYYANSNDGDKDAEDGCSSGACSI